MSTGTNGGNGSDDGKKDELTAPGDFAFGDLNAMYKSVLRSFHEYGDQAASLIKKMQTDYLQPDHHISTGPYKAVVLRVETNHQGGEAAATDSRNAGKGNAEPELIQLKCRIPEMHAALPIPSAFGSIPGLHNAIIDMFHTFTAQSDHVMPVEPGELVWVDFADKRSMSGGMYIRPVAEREKVVNFVKETSGAAAHGACGQYNPGSTSGGDGAPTANTPSGRAGHPQTTRSKTPTGPNIYIEGGSSSVAPGSALDDERIKAITAQVRTAGTDSPPITTDADKTKIFDALTQLGRREENITAVKRVWREQYPTVQPPDLEEWLRAQLPPEDFERAEELLVSIDVPAQPDDTSGSPSKYTAPNPVVLAKWKKYVEATGAKGCKSWIGKMAANAGLHVIIHVPGTTELENPLEVAYYVHGAGSWANETMWDVLAKECKAMGEAGRNFILVFPNIKGATPGYWAKSGTTGGGSICHVDTAVVEEVARTMNSGTAINVVFRSICAFSIGGRPVARAAASDGDLAYGTAGCETGCCFDKITLADIVPNDDAFNNLMNNVVLRSTKKIELNIMGFTTGGDPRAKQSWETAVSNLTEKKMVGEGLTDDSPTDYSSAKGIRALIGKTPNGGLAYITRANNWQGHAAYGIKSFAWIPPVYEQIGARAAPSAGVGGGDLSKVVIFGTSLIGGDADATGGMAIAVKKVLVELGANASNMVIAGVSGSNIKQWLGKKSFSDGKPKAKQEGLSVEWAKNQGATVYVVAIGGNDYSYGSTEAKIQEFVGLAREVLEILDPLKKIPILWYGHVTNDSAKSEPVQLLYKGIDQGLANYPNLLVQYPETDHLRSIYLTDPGHGSGHPKHDIHEVFVRARLDEVKSFLGVTTATAAPPAEPTEPTPGPTGGQVSNSNIKMSSTQLPAPSPNPNDIPSGIYVELPDPDPGRPMIDDEGAPIVTDLDPIYQAPTDPPPAAGQPQSVANALVELDFWGRGSIKEPYDRSNQPGGPNFQKTFDRLFQ